MKLSDMKTSEQVLEEELRDPEFQREWDRTAVARAVALKVLAFRTEHGLSQRTLAKKLDMTQPQLARLEAGEHNPTIDTLARLAQTLDLEFAIDIHPRQRRPSSSADLRRAETPSPPTRLTLPPCCSPRDDADAGPGRRADPIADNALRWVGMRSFRNGDDSSAGGVPRNEFEAFEAALRTLSERARSDDAFAHELYAALCNMRWRRRDSDSEPVSMSWRYAGGIASDLACKGGCYWARRFALAPARRLEVAPLRVGWCVWLIFSDGASRRCLVERSP
jgi:transcriptional regulator with XRE-family HTH domain